MGSDPLVRTGGPFTVEYYIAHRRAGAAADPLLAFFLPEGDAAPAAPLAEVDRALGGLVARVRGNGEFRGKHRQTTLLHNPGKEGPERVLLVGLGKPGTADLESFRRAAGAAGLAAKAAGAAAFSAVLPDLPGVPLRDLTVALLEGVTLSLYDFSRHKTEKVEAEKAEGPRSLTVVDEDGRGRPEVEQGLALGRVLAEAACWCRDVANTPGNEGTPTFLAERAAEIAREGRMQLTVLDRADMEREGMGGVLGVARGSHEPPKFIVLEHNPGREDLDTVALVGKGITFDSGGISIKPAENMHEMKFDKCGGVAVLATMRALGRLRLPLRVVGIVPATENLPGGSAYKPGDVVRTLGGKSVEILNTDAEGRMILVDGITWAKRYRPKAIVDLATLTGACMVALGDQAAGLFSTDDALAGQLQRASEATGERLWRMPLYPEYTEQIRSDVADYKNTGGRLGGASTAAALLQAHAEGVPWAHLDIAPTAWTSKDRDYLRKGATGFGPRTLLRFLLARAGQG